MTAEPQKEYIITEERLQNLIYIVYRDGGVKMDDGIHDALQGIRSRPYKSSDKVLEELEEWLEGYLDTGYEGSAGELKDIKKQIKKLRQQQQGER